MIRKNNAAGDIISGISPDVVVEKVDNVWGSTAGAGSDFFHIYRKHRYAEMDRLKKMDEDWDAQQERESFDTEREKLQKLDEETTTKKREKRKRKQESRNRNAKMKRIENDVSVVVKSLTEPTPREEEVDKEIGPSITITKHTEVGSV